MGYVAFIVGFVVVAGVGEAWRVLTRRKSPDWMAEGNRRVW